MHTCKIHAIEFYIKVLYIQQKEQHEISSDSLTIHDDFRGFFFFLLDLFVYRMFIQPKKKNSFKIMRTFLFVSRTNLHHCYVMLWPALTWRGQEWAQHVQGQILHTCIMQAAGSSHVMELLTDSI